jgi:hypothetical protein
MSLVLNDALVLIFVSQIVLVFVLLACYKADIPIRILELMIILSWGWLLCCL